MLSPSNEHSNVTTEGFSSAREPPERADSFLAEWNSLSQGSLSWNCRHVRLGIDPEQHRRQRSILVPDAKFNHRGGTLDPFYHSAQKFQSNLHRRTG